MAAGNFGTGVRLDGCKTRPEVDKCVGTAASGAGAAGGARSVGSGVRRETARGFAIGKGFIAAKAGSSGGNTGIGATGKGCGAWAGITGGTSG